VGTKDKDKDGWRATPEQTDALVRNAKVQIQMGFQFGFYGAL
jgi:hypothetical protein